MLTILPRLPVSGQLKISPHTMGKPAPAVCLPPGEDSAVEIRVPLHRIHHGGRVVQRNPGVKAVDHEQAPAGVAQRLDLLPDQGVDVAWGAIRRDLLTIDVEIDANPADKSATMPMSRSRFGSSSVMSNRRFS